MSINKPAPPASNAPSTPTAPAPNPCRVPRLTGLTLAVARTRLTGAGCAVGKVTAVLASTKNRGRVLRQHRLPDAMLLLPGVIDTTTNYVEHPEVVADRICAAVEAVGDRTRVIASTDCGFGTFAGSEMVAHGVVWAKLGALTEGAAIASRRLWS